MSIGLHCTVTTAASLDACVDVIDEYDDVSGTEINWEKTLATCSPTPPATLPGRLAHVRVLQIGEVEKYIGMLHGPSAEDWAVGAQLVSKLQKKCAELQTPFHSLPARATIVNSILLGQLWYFLTVWVPTPAETKELQRIIRSFLWGKSADSHGQGGRVAWAPKIRGWAGHN